MTAVAPIAMSRLDSDALIENLDCALVLVDAALVIRRVNVATETLLARSRKYLLEAPLMDVLPVAELEHYVRSCFDEIAHCTLREAVISFEQQNVLVDITLQRLNEAPREHDFVLLEISNINRVSRFAREQNQLERQKSFRLMMRGLAHEIKNPLGGLRGAAQLLERSFPDDDESRELTHILIKEADRLTQLVDRVMGSRELLKPQNVNIHELIEHVARLVGVDAPQNIAFVRDYDPTLPEISVDREQMIQALLNLLQNAVQAQSGDDRITIGLVTEFERLTTINEKTYRQALCIKVWDQGSGVPEALRAIVFDPLITNRSDGTGLGLSITQEIVQRHEGTIHLTNLDGKTCFTILLPYLDSLVEGPESADQAEVAHG